MLRIILEQADNGVIKTVLDDNINGAGEEYESKIVYDFDNNSNFSVTKKFLYELTEDLDVDTGNKFDKDTLTMEVNWGSSFQPSLDDIKNKIKSHEIEIAYLKEMLKNIKEN